jgi:hypothetical protein
MESADARNLPTPASLTHHYCTEKRHKKKPPYNMPPPLLVLQRFPILAGGVWEGRVDPLEQGGAHLTILCNNAIAMRMSHFFCLCL